MLSSYGKILLAKIKWYAITYNGIFWCWNHVIVWFVFGNIMQCYVWMIFNNLVTFFTKCFSFVLIDGNFRGAAACNNSDVEERDLLNILPIFELYYDYLPALHATWRWVTNIFVILCMTDSFLILDTIHSIKECKEITSLFFWWIFFFECTGSEYFHSCLVGLFVDIYWEDTYYKVLNEYFIGCKRCSDVCLSM